MEIAVIGIRGLPGVQGGVENHCECIFPLCDDSVKFRVYRRKPYLNETTLAAKYPNITFVDLPSTRIKGFEAVLHTFLCCMHLIFHRVDLVNIHNIGPGMFTPLLRLFGLKVLLTYHSANYEHKKWGTFAKMLLRFSEFLSLNMANKIIFVNKFQMAKYPEKIKAKSVYIPNGINKVTRSEGTGFLDKFGLKKKEYILAVGRITPEKGFDWLIRAVNKADNIRTLVIAGASDHDTAYFEQLKALDVNHKTVFTGFTTGEDLRQLYSHARMYVLSSVNEGFPLVMLEAMSYSLPMVVTDIPATHLIEIDSSCYAKKADDDSLAERISAKYDVVPDGEKYELDDYDWDKIARLTVDTYKSVKH